jgi:hypothetical protein
MEEFRKLALASDAPSDGDSRPSGPTGEASDRRLEITVIVTSFENTVAAVKQAGMLLQGLDGSISLVDAQSVHHALALERPPISPDFSRRKILAIAEESTVEIRAHIYWCRSRLETLAKVLRPGSPVVIGIRKRWWPSWENKLARQLQRLGHEVVALES